MGLRLSVHRRSSPKPLTHAWVRSIGRGRPAWIGAGRPGDLPQLGRGHRLGAHVLDHDAIGNPATVAPPRVGRGELGGSGPALPEHIKTRPPGALARRMQSEEAACRARCGTVRIMTPARTTFAPQPIGTRSRARLEVIGAPDTPVPPWAIVWCDQTGVDLICGLTLPDWAFEPGPRFKGWPQVTADIATSTAAGAAVLVNRPTWPGSVAPCVVAALEELPDDIEVLADAAGCAAALDETLLLVHGVPVSFGERSLGIDAALARGRAVLAAGTSLLTETRPSVRVMSRLLRAHPHELVTEDIQADLVVVGGAPVDSSRELGLVTLSAIQHAPCAVLVTPRAPGIHRSRFAPRL
jgi:nucleotide-binding universal stress UspA family protein